eukprot:1983250-Pleurochrysis_carterae.AAC.4
MLHTTVSLCQAPPPTTPLCNLSVGCPSLPSLTTDLHSNRHSFQQIYRRRAERLDHARKHRGELHPGRIVVVISKRISMRDGRNGSSVREIRGCASFFNEAKRSREQGDHVWRPNSCQQPWRQLLPTRHATHASRFGNSM